MKRPTGAATLRDAFTSYLGTRAPRNVKCTVCRTMDPEGRALIAEFGEAAEAGTAEVSRHEFIDWLVKPLAHGGGGYERFTWYMIRTHMQRRHWLRASVGVAARSPNASKRS